MTRRRNALLGLVAVLMFSVIVCVASAQEAPAVGPAHPAQAPAPNGTQQATLYAVVAMVVMQVSGWLKQVLDAQRERRAAAEAEAEEAKAEAKVYLDPTQSAQLNSHETRLSGHDIEIAALKNSFAKYERENREDHSNMFGRLDKIKDLLIGKKGS